MRWKAVAGGWALAGILVVTGCSTAPASRPDDAAANADQQGSADEADQETPATLPDFAAAASAPEVASLSWGADQSLRIGYADGKWARVAPGEHGGEVDTAIGESAAVVALSPEHKLAFVATDPPLVIRVRDHQTVMRLSKVADLQAAGFFADGSGLYAAEPDGKLHVWRQPEADLDEVSTTDLKEFMARQSATFTANLPPLRGQILATPDNVVFMATAQGKVLEWNPESPNELNALVKLPAAARSFGWSGRYLAVTTEGGDLRVVDVDRSSYVPWSMDQRGQWVAASPAMAGGFAVADADGVGVRAFEDGAYRWQAKLADGATLCGLSMAPGAKRLAVCINSGVVVLDAANGDVLAAVRRDGETLAWQK